MTTVPLLLTALIFGTLSPAFAQTTVPPAPKGIYLLNDGTTPVAKMKLPTFLSGFSLRIGWSDIEKSKGVYDFKAITEAISTLQSKNLKLTLSIFASVPPAYILTGASSTFNTNMGKAPTPWDPLAQAQWKAMLNALAKHQVWDAVSKRKVALSDHPTLTAINAPVVGLQSIRDIKGELVKKPDYTRNKFITAVASSVRSCRDAFPKDYLFIGFFKMQDSDTVNPLDEAVMAQLKTDFMGTGKAGLGLFQETWSDIGPNPLSLGSFLVGVQAPNAVMLQALTSWKRPFNYAENVTSKNPNGALDRAFVELGCTYFELYSPDINATDLQPMFQQWSTFLARQ